MFVRLYVLGLINHRDTYGYQIKATAHLWGLERWGQIQDGSIYHALAQMQREGLIMERRVEQAENKRPRHIYSITPQGREAFLEMLRNTLRAAPCEGRDIDLALAFIEFLAPAERVALLTERQQRLEAECADLEQRLAGLGDLAKIEWIPNGMRHSLGRLQFEVAWNREMLENVANWPAHL